MRRSRKYMLTSSEPLTVKIFGAIKKKDPRAKYYQKSAQHPEHIVFDSLQYYQVLRETSQFNQPFTIDQAKKNAN